MGYDEYRRESGDGISTRRGRSGAYLHLDRIHERARGRRGAQLAALTSGGAIPDKADYAVVEETTGASDGLNSISSRAARNGSTPGLIAAV